MLHCTLKELGARYLLLGLVLVASPTVTMAKVHAQAGQGQ